MEPIKMTLRSYQVGFGDCYLLILGYSDGSERFILIDFGSTGLPEGFPDQMLKIAKNIKERCGENGLDAVVASHRHKDHISGFSGDTPESSGGIIKSCTPKVVIQPWTEDPDLEERAKAPIPLIKPQAEVNEELLETGFAKTLGAMHKVAGMVAKEADRLATKLHIENLETRGFASPLDKKQGELLRVMGENNIKNRSAVKNLREMGKENKWVYHGYDLDLSNILPGVKAHVLGPPTIDQYKDVVKQRSRDDKEFWMLRALHNNFWKMQAGAAAMNAEMTEKNEFDDHLFPNADIFERDYDPPHKRWFIRQMRELRAEELFGIVRILDSAMNNTSVILLFEIGDKKLLFPGDAQIENWEYALKYAPEEIRNEHLALLRDTSLYKVGHHGSRNATPKTLWKQFANKVSNNVAKDESLVSVMSTMTGKHGHTPETAVPRETLVAEIKKNTRFHTTQEIKKDSGAGADSSADANGLYFDIEI